MTDRKRTIALLPVALLLLLASCGGGDESTRQTANTHGASGPSGATSHVAKPVPSAAPTGPKRSHAKGRKRPSSKKIKSQSGGASPSAPKANAGIEALKRKTKQLEKSLQKKTKKKSNKGGKPAPAKPRPSPKRSAKPDEVLYLKAKRICETLGIDTLAKKYKVEPTAEAVAAAYAASYPPVFRTAVHDGCRAGFAGR